VFYAVIGFRAKLRMVDAAVQTATRGRTELSQAWKKLYKRMEAKNIVRNKVAHFSVINFPNGKAGRRINLRPAIFDPKNPPISCTTPTGGFFLKDLEAIPGQFSPLAHALENFAARVSGRKEPFPKEFELEPHQRPKTAGRTAAG
jgi:hypothetical protein